MSTFTKAAISYHGIPPDVVVRSDVHTGDDGVLYLTVQIPIMDEDLGPIVKRMEQMTTTVQDDAVFVPDDLGQLREDWAALTPAERGKYKSFARYKTHRQAEQFEADGLSGVWRERPTEEVDKLVRGEQARIGADIREGFEPSEGIGGRKVQHVDVPEEPEAESELPAAVWAHAAELTDTQLIMSSDADAERKMYLIQVDMLTPEQKAKYCGEQKP